MEGHYADTHRGPQYEDQPRAEMKCFECDLGDKAIFIFAHKKVSNDTGVAFFKDGEMIVHVQAKKQIIMPDQEHA